MSDPSQPHHGSHAAGSHYQPPLGVVLTIVVLFVAATFLMLRSPSPSTPTTSTLPAGSSTTTKPHSKVVPKSQVRVQVANGTSTPKLAGRFTQQLLTLGWDTLPALNANKVIGTIVYFNPQFRWAALEIASEIHVSSHAVQPLNGLHPVSNAASDDVIVLLGPDLAVG